MERWGTAAISDKRNNSKESVDLYKVTVVDVVLIVLIVVISTGVILRTKLGLNFHSAKASEASVYHEGELFKHLSLDQHQEIILLGGKMLVEVNEGRIRVKKSDCPRQICVNAGWIKYAGEAVVCVPYKTIIEIESAGTPLVDAVVY